MHYAYIARTKDDHTQRGEVDASSLTEARKIIRDQGLFVLSLVPKREKGFLLNFLRGRVSLKDKMIFTKELSMMIKSGLPLVEALEAMGEQTTSKALQEVTAAMIKDVKGGVSLSDAFAKHPRVFPFYYKNIIRSGEKSGKLDEVLLRLSTQIEKDYALVAKVRGAMVYPALIVVAIIGVVILMMIFVIPQIKNIFEESGVQLPLLTRILIASSNFSVRYFYLIIIVFFGVVFGLGWFLRTPSGGLAWDRLKIRLPIFGSLFKKIYMARFSRTMAMLTKAGLPILEALDTVGDVINNGIYKQSLAAIAKQVETGVPLSNAMKKDKNFPAMVTHLVAVGEKSGNLEYVLSSLADFFDAETDNLTSNLAALLEPILMIFMGVGVGFIVAAIIMPMYNLVNAI